MASNSSETVFFIDEPELENVVLDFPNYIDTISNLILNSRPNYTIGIFGNWGTGKTTLMENIETRLTKSECNCIKFNAWRFAHEERHATYPLMLTILNSILEKNEIKTSLDGGNLEKLKGKLIRVAKGLKGSVTLKIPELVDATLEVDPSKMISDEESDIEKLFQKSKTPLQEGLEIIEDFIIEVKGQPENNALKLIVFIDDLDRCTPEKAVEVFESVKIFFEITGIVFVFGINQEIIETAIDYKYQHFKGKFKGEDYLKKIIQVPFVLPPWIPSDVSHYLKTLIKNYPNPEYKKFFTENLELISNSVIPNPREVKRLLNKFILASKIHQKNPRIDKQKLLSLHALAHRWRNFYEDMMISPKFLKDILKEYSKIVDAAGKNANTTEEIEKNIRNEVFQSPLLKEIPEIEDILYFVNEVGKSILSITDNEWPEYRRAVIKEIPEKEGITAYCVQCRAKIQVKDPIETKLKNGRPAVKGSCPRCGTTVFRIGKMN